MPLLKYGCGNTIGGKEFHKQSKESKKASDPTVQEFHKNTKLFNRNIYTEDLGQKISCRFNAIHINISVQFFMDLERIIFNLIWKSKKPRITETILYNKKTSRSITILDFKFYCRPLVINSP